MLNQISLQHAKTIQLWYLVQHSLSAFRKLEQFFGSVEAAVSTENLSKWSEIKLHKSHLERAKEILTPLGEQKFQRCLDQVKQYTDFIVTESELYYPQQLLPYNDHPPILFGKGNLQNLSQPQIAIVGSRKPSPHGKQVSFDFAYYLSEKGFFITSGLAQGIDEAAHMGALENHRTIAVIGTGLDLTYPSQNAGLQKKILQNSGTVISEFLPNTKPLQQHFPRRNRIVSGLSIGILVAEAAVESGSLITAKLAAEQGKLTFAIPGHIYSDFHRGCHQLIREGAILVDHPEQLIEDVALPTQWHYQQKNDESSRTDISPTINTSTSNDIPQHLFLLYQQLDWTGQDIDSLSEKLNINIAELTASLMELELLGLCIQQSGLYLRCRKSF